MSHFLSTCHLSSASICALLEKAETYLSDNTLVSVPHTPLQNKIVANLFFENSTRTRSAFEIAAHKLGGYALQFDTQNASIQKGETILDTIENLTAMGVDIFVVRHGEVGMPAKIAAQLKNRASVINAGDGTGEHPTQAMLDLFTIYRYKKYKSDYQTNKAKEEKHATNKHPLLQSDLSVAIVGDIRHSRVARSLCFVLSTVGVQDIRLIGPPSFLPTDAHYPWDETCPQKQPSPVRYEENLQKGIQDADVVIMLRIQKERITQSTDTSLDKADYIQNYCLTPEMLTYAKPNAIVMHPGPMNRGVEITSEVADGPQSVILEQPKLGVAMRMAILEACIAV